MGRSIFIGDVHGCCDELDDLIRRLEVTLDDIVYFVGDLVARGPDSQGVLARCRSLSARAVMGNHEQRLLDARRARKKGKPLPKLGESHVRLLDELNDEEWAQLKALPLWLDVPEHGLRVVHAGVVPGIPIDEQEPIHLLTLRSIDEHGEPTSRSGFELWGARYHEPPHIVFGHNAVAKLQLHPFATGLDTGCVYGGQLTALVLEGGAVPEDPEQRLGRLVSVQARKAYLPMVSPS